MAGHGGPDLVQDGLVLSLDAASKNSYPGSGTTWSDLSTSGTDGTLSDAGIGTVSGSLNTMAFDGTDDQFTISSPTGFVSAVGSVSHWFKLTNSDVGQGIWHFYENSTQDYIRSYMGSNNKLDLLIEDDNDGKIAVEYDFDNLYGADAFVDKWLYIVWTQDGSGVKFYINGTDYSSALTGTNNGDWWTSHLNVGTVKLCNVWAWMNCLVSAFNVYNKALSAKEVSQNFNAQRSRFGV